MAKEVKNRVSLDASRFERGVKDVRRGIRSLEKGLTIDLKTAAKLGGAAILAVGAAGIGIGAGIAAGIKAVIKLGADLDHLSTQTGVAAGDLLVLQQAFEDNGVSAEKVGPSIGKMQKTIAEAGQGLHPAIDALDMLGISTEQILKMSPAEQFDAIGSAINSISDPAKKTAVAMDIFGKSGAELITLFAAGGLDDARNSLGTQAELLQKNAKILERAGTLLDRTGTKLRGFFVGIADKVVPVILPLLEQFDKLDLAKQGQMFGESIATGIRVLIGAFQNNQIGELIGLSLQRAALSFINAVYRGWWGILNGIWKGLVDIATAFRDVIGGGLLSVAQQFGSSILGFVAKGLEHIPGMGDASKSVMKEAIDLYTKGQETADFVANRVANIGSSIVEAFQLGVAEAEGISLFNTDKIDSELSKIVSDALAAIPDAATKPSETGQPVKPAPTFQDFAKPVVGGVSTLAAIGGGGGVGKVSGVESLVDQSRKQTGLMADIKTGVNKLVESFSKGGPVNVVPVMG